MSIHLSVNINGIELPKCCSNCDFYKPPANNVEGQCINSPPQIVVVYSKIKNPEGIETEVANGHSAWPPVQPNSICGAWELRMAPPEPFQTTTVHLDPRIVSSLTGKMVQP